VVCPSKDGHPSQNYSRDRRESNSRPLSRTSKGLTTTGPSKYPVALIQEVLHAQQVEKENANRNRLTHVRLKNDG